MHVAASPHVMLDPPTLRRGRFRHSSQVPAVRTDYGRKKEGGHTPRGEIQVPASGNLFSFVVWFHGILDGFPASFHILFSWGEGPSCSEHD